MLEEFGRIYGHVRGDAFKSPDPPDRAPQPYPKLIRNQAKRRVKDPAELADLMEKNCPPELLCDFDAETWLADPANFALRDGDDLGLAEAGSEWPGPLTIHTFYTSRGKQAMTVARTMIEHCIAYGATELRGEIQVTRRHVITFARLLGFRPVEEIERPKLGKFAVLALHNIKRGENVP